jgi:hypothetical protein
MKKFFIGCFIFSYIVLAIWGAPILLAASRFHSHHHSPGCPFMPGEYVVCTMTIMDHIIAWKNVFMSTAPIVLVFLAPLVFVYFLHTRDEPPDFFVRQHRHSLLGAFIPPPLYQKLFSKGILNPRIF